MQSAAPMSSKMRTDRGPPSLSTTPVNKRSRISLRRKDNMSPRQQTLSSDGSKQGSPSHSPGLPRTPTYVQAGSTMRSPLTNSTNSTPSRWLGSQEPHRDITWDNTSPVNARGLKGPQKGVVNIRDLCSNLGSGSYCKDDCLSQISGLSDKWLSLGNDLQPGQIPTYTRLFSSKELANASRKVENEGGQQGVKPSKNLKSLLNKLQKPKRKGALNFEETASEDSAEDEIQILAPNSDPITIDNNSADDFWGEEDDNSSFFLKVSQSLDLFDNNPTKRKADLVIPSTLSEENCTSSSVSSNDPSKNVLRGTSVDRNSKNSSLQNSCKNPVFKVPSAYTSSSSSTESASSVNSKNSTLPSTAHNITGMTFQAKKNRLSRGTAFKGPASVIPTAASPLSLFYGPSKVARKDANEYKRTIECDQKMKQLQKTTAERPDEIDIFTLDEDEMNPGNVGMPGVWMSQASPVELQTTNHLTSASQAGMKGLTPRSQSKRNTSNQVVDFTILQNVPEKLDIKNRLIGLGITPRSKSFDVPKCVPLVGKSQIKEDHDDPSLWGEWDATDCSQEIFDLLDLGVEPKISNKSMHKETQSQCEPVPTSLTLSRNSGSLRKEATLEPHQKQSQSEPVPTITLSRNSGSLRKEGMELHQKSEKETTPVQHQLSGNIASSASFTSQNDNSYKRQCSRMEINRKKAEALRKRRLREEAQNRSKGAGRGLWRTNSMT